MKKEGQITGIKHISIINNLILISSSYSLLLNGKVLVESDNIGGSLLSDKWLYFMDNNRTVLSKIGEDKTYEDNSRKKYFWNSINLDNFSVAVGINKKLMGNSIWVFEYWQYNFQTQELIPLNQVQSYPIPVIWEGHLLFDETKFLLSAFSIEKKEIVWQFKLFENFKYDRTWGDGEFYHFVGVWNNILWIDIKESHLIGLDTQTGRLKYDFCKPSKIFGKGTKPYHHQLHDKFCSNIDKERNLLFGFHYDTYWEVNLNDSNPELYFYIFEEECTKYNCFLALSMRYCYDKQNLYYIDAFNGTISSINRDTKAFQFLYQFPEASAGTLMEIQVSLDKIYVLDNQGTLHIFERETV